ncbi:hypothetical protein SEPCBS57363_001388 [Sporothrix epigloea]|uniref:Uncharacterized protein n=1 Tax=Sporothrix epigloea TaxID=1892477 RepID=A0ABP0DA08_9PEZI
MKLNLIVIASSLALTVAAAPTVNSDCSSYEARTEQRYQVTDMTDGPGQWNAYGGTGMNDDSNVPGTDDRNPFDLPNGQSDGGQGPVGLGHHNHHWPWEETAEESAEVSRNV